MREKKDINIYIGNEIRIARERAGLTQEQFGEMVSLGTKNISAIERGVTGITSDSLLFGEQEKNDVTYLAERLERLPPEQFAAVKEFLNQIFALFARLNP